MQFVRDQEFSKVLSITLFILFSTRKRFSIAQKVPFVWLRIHGQYENMFRMIKHIYVINFPCLQFFIFSLNWNPKSFLWCYKDRSDTSKSPNIAPCNFLLEISKPFWRGEKKLKQHGVLKSALNTHFLTEVSGSQMKLPESVNGVREDRQAD